VNGQSGQIELYQSNAQDQMGPQGFGGYNLPVQWSYYNPPSPRLPRDFELVIEKVGSEIVLDYGAKLRLLIADPFAGIDLREAIAKLKEALKNGG
jgi:hypothetical protein